MTLKFRNRFFISLWIVFSLVAICLLSFFIYAVLHSRISFPDFIRTPEFLGRATFLPFSRIGVCLSIITLLLYSGICIGIIVFNFEKTNCVEIVFFAGFLISCCFEGFRLMLPTFGIWQTFSAQILFFSRIVLAARLFAPLTFVLAAAMKEDALSQDVGVKFLASALATVLIASLVPVNSGKITSTMVCCWGFSRSLSVIRFLLFVSALVSFSIETRKNGEEGLYGLTAWFSILYLGYVALISCDTLVFFAAGVLLLFFGTYKYLKTIHQNYLWR